MSERISVRDLRNATASRRHQFRQERRTNRPGVIVHVHDVENCELCALVEAVEAARTVNDWWVLRSLRAGDPMDGESGEAKQQARALNAALARFDFAEVPA